MSIVFIYSIAEKQFDLKIVFSKFSKESIKLANEYNEMINLINVKKMQLKTITHENSCQKNIEQ